MKIALNKKNRNVLAIPIIALLMSGCSKDISDLQAFIEKTKTDDVGSVTPIKQFKPYQSFTYSAADLRDPFISHVDITEDSGTVKNSLQHKAERPRQHLEIFPLDALSMVGTLEQKNNSWGLVKDPKDIVHQVKLGNYMGQNEGLITKITETKIFLVEILPDGVGGYIEREASIAIGNE